MPRSSPSGLSSIDASRHWSPEPTSPPARPRCSQPTSPRSRGNSPRRMRNFRKLSRPLMRSANATVWAKRRVSSGKSSSPGFGWTRTRLRRASRAAQRKSRNFDRNSSGSSRTPRPPSLNTSPGLKSSARSSRRRRNARIRPRRARSSTASSSLRRPSRSRRGWSRRRRRTRPSANARSAPKSPSSSPCWRRSAVATKPAGPPPPPRRPNFYRAGRRS
mmetsp:Transcript_7961/g.35174  ORF Transcript_7961/g.35174 Transcript_7961/m.35174 type:complete len:218 (+) Transcript_7961:3950-4603(+)